MFITSDDFNIKAQTAFVLLAHTHLPAPVDVRG